MKLPTRSPQHKSEDDSLAVLKYKLKDLGIFREQGSNDYGIDCELELVKGTEVTGRFLKVQVKSSKKVKLRKDGIATVSGIKQSTLAYWCEHSFSTNVLAYLVDLDTENIYVSRSLFWQASKLIDAGEKTKSIEFLPSGDNPNLTAHMATLVQAIAPKIPDIVSAHKTALRNLNKYLELLVGAYHYDAPLEIHDPEHFEELLEVSRILLWRLPNDAWANGEDAKYWRNYKYWVQKSEAEGFDGLSFYASQKPLSVIVPALFDELHRLSSEVLEGRYYWANKSPSYLGLVYQFDIPGDNNSDGLRDAQYASSDFKRRSGWEVDSFIEQSRSRGT